jgi:hypothetical protein
MESFQQKAKVHKIKLPTLNSSLLNQAAPSINQSDIKSSNVKFLHKK